MLMSGTSSYFASANIIVCCLFRIYFFFFFLLVRAHCFCSFLFRACLKLTINAFFFCKMYYKNVLTQTSITIQPFTLPLVCVSCLSAFMLQHSQTEKWAFVKNSHVNHFFPFTEMIPNVWWSDECKKNCNCYRFKLKRNARFHHTHTQKQTATQKRWIRDEFIRCSAHIVCMLQLPGKITEIA